MPLQHHTETLDRLFLELSLVTNAFTGRELALAKAIERAFLAGLSIGNDPRFSMDMSQEQWKQYQEVMLKDFEPILKAASTQ